MTTDEGVPTTIPTADGDLPAVHWTPAAGHGPGILLLQEIFGVSPYIRRRAAALAEAGYVVLAPELYWRLDPALPPLDESAPDVVETAMGALDRSTPTVVSGWKNSLLASGYRVTPRRLMLAVSERLLKSAN